MNIRESYSEEHDIYAIHIGDDKYEVSHEVSLVLDTNKKGEIIGAEIFCAKELISLIKKSEKSRKNFLDIISKLLSETIPIK